MLHVGFARDAFLHPLPSVTNRCNILLSLLYLDLVTKRCVDLVYELIYSSTKFGSTELASCAPTSCMLATTADVVDCVHFVEPHTPGAHVVVLVTVRLRLLGSTLLHVVHITKLRDHIAYVAALVSCKVRWCGRKW
jgi:hypothetical protein